jgi:hypothetical protein
MFVIGQNLKVPKKGKCRAVTGFETASISSNPPVVPRPVTGTTCLNAQDDLLRAGFVLQEVYDSRLNNSGAVHHTVQVGMDIPYATLTGGSCQILLPNGDDLVRQDVFAGPCQVPLFS